MDHLLPIGAFSARSGLSAKRLRTYAAEGLLQPAAVDPDTGYRFYTSEQLEDAELIDALRRADVPLSQIRMILRDRCHQHLDAWAGRLRTDAKRKQQALHRARELLSATDVKSRGLEGSTTLHIDTASRSDQGPVREDHEDAAVARDHLIAVADGMGGHPAGATAAALATAVMSAVVTAKSVDELETAVRAANWAVWQRATDDSELHGMGTTLCAVAAVHDEFAVANVGDSRAYLGRHGELRVITADHTVAAQLVRDGELTAAEAPHHPHRRFLTRAIGVNPQVVVDVVTLAMSDGDRVLVCSDGVHTVVTDDEISALLDSCDTPTELVDSVVERALIAGTDDNVAAAAMYVTARPGDPRPYRPSHSGLTRPSS